MSFLFAPRGHIRLFFVSMSFLYALLGHIRFFFLHMSRFLYLAGLYIYFLLHMSHLLCLPGLYIYFLLYMSHLLFQSGHFFYLFLICPICFIWQNFTFTFSPYVLFAQPRFMSFSTITLHLYFCLYSFYEHTVCSSNIFRLYTRE